MYFPGIWKEPGEEGEAAIEELSQKPFPKTSLKVPQLMPPGRNGEELTENTQGSIVCRILVNLQKKERMDNFDLRHLWSFC